MRVVASLTGSPPPAPHDTRLRRPSSAPVVQLAASGGHACARHADGTVTCWGDNDLGQVVDHASAHVPIERPSPFEPTTSVVATPAQVPITDALEIATGVYRTCARRADGVWCWGSPPGPPERVTAMTDAVEITDVCARTAAGQVWCWYGLMAADREPRLEPAIAIVEAGGLTCSLSPERQVRCVDSAGRDVYSLVTLPEAVGLAAAHDFRVCTPLSSGAVTCYWPYYAEDYNVVRAIPVDEVEQVALTNHGACARSSDRRVRCWASPNAPVRAVEGVAADELVSGFDFTCVRDGGAVWCWGDDAEGELGDGQSQIRATPVAVPGIDDAIDVHVTSTFSCVRRRGGAVSCWGAYRDASPGAADPTPREVPQARDAVELAGETTLFVRYPDGAVRRDSAGSMTSTGMSDVVRLASSATHVLGVTGRGTVFGWGGNYYGQLGTGATGSTTGLAFAATVIDDVVAAAAGDNSSCFVRRTGAVACLGKPPRPSGVHRSAPPLPRDVVGIDHAIDVALGDDFGCALIGDHTVRCWGAALRGQLGRALMDATTTAATPVQGLGDVVQLVADGQTACARRGDGTVACWGDNRAGVIAEPYELAFSDGPLILPLTDVRDLSVSTTHACAVVGSGTVLCWGNVASAALGTPLLDSRPPTRVPLPGP